MTRLSIAPASADDARIGGFLDRQKRRVDAMPPGMCPLAQQLTLLEEGALQTCGKCVPCRDGLPQLAEMLRHLVDCQADAAEVERMRALAEMVRDTSDCAIGYESANALLEGLDAFAAEVESHEFTMTASGRKENRRARRQSRKQRSSGHVHKFPGRIVHKLLCL